MLVEGRGVERGESEASCVGARMYFCSASLVTWIKEIQEDIVPRLKQNKPGSYNKYYAYTDHTCANRNQIYESKHIYQSYLRQILSNPTLLPLFSLNAKPHLEPDLYQTLKQWVAQEED